ncbi:hypothetical protein R6Q59_023959 [Mikania micrantha]
MNNGTNRPDRVEDEEPDYPWKTMSRWLEAGLLQSLRHSDCVHSFRILTPISTSPSIVSTLRSLSACWLTKSESPITQCLLSAHVYRRSSLSILAVVFVVTGRKSTDLTTINVSQRKSLARVPDALIKGLMAVLLLARALVPVPFITGFAGFWPSLGRVVAYIEFSIMRTRKRSYSPPPLFPISSVCSSSSPSSSKMSSGNTEFWITYEDKYIEILEDIWSGYDQSIGRSWDWSFWEKFCVRMMNECKFEAFPNMIESCMNYRDYLKKIHRQMKFPARVQPSSRPHIEALKSMYKDRLGNIFDVCRPTTSKARRQRKKSASMLKQSSSGGISSVKRLGNGKGIHQALGELVKHGTLQYSDVEVAKEYTDICIAYHLLRQGGIQKQHIVLFMGDDVAFDDWNFNLGVIQYNRSSPDVYSGIMKDYTSQNLTLHNFLAVLTGNRSLLKGGSGRVLETKPSDRVFLYYAGHGSLDAIRT